VEHAGAELAARKWEWGFMKRNGAEVEAVVQEDGGDEARAVQPTHVHQSLRQIQLHKHAGNFYNESSFLALVRRTRISPEQ
jgi:hypothetical protein